MAFTDASNCGPSAHCGNSKQMVNYDPALIGSFTPPPNQWAEWSGLTTATDRSGRLGFPGRVKGLSRVFQSRKRGNLFAIFSQSYSTSGLRASDSSSSINSNGRVGPEMPTLANEKIHLRTPTHTL